MADGAADTAAPRSLLQRLLGRKAAEPSGATAADLPDDPRSAIAFGNAIIYLGLGAFLIWAFAAPLDEGVPASGVVAVESVRKVVSHLNGGTVGIIHVRENQRVQAGDLLVTLDNAKALNTFETVLQDYVAAAAKLARLNAEKTLDDHVVFSADLVKLADEAGRQDLLRDQERLFRIRQVALTNELAILRENLASTQKQAAGTRQQIGERTHEVALLREEIQNLKPLVEAGYAPRNRLSEQERSLASLSGSATELQTREQRELSSISETQLRLIQRRKDFLKEAETAFADTQREVTNLRERLDDARRELEKTVIRAPVAGQVVALQTQTTGAALNPGSKVLEIVPEGEKLLLDVKVPVHTIDKVKPGLVTYVRSAAFLDNPSLVVEGRIQSLSSDRHTPVGTTEQPYYLARVEITEKGMHELGHHNLRPGMPVDVSIKTGERNLIAYLLTPITKRTFTAFHEP